MMRHVFSLGASPGVLGNLKPLVVRPVMLSRVPGS